MDLAATKATASLRATKRGTLSREEQAKKNALLAKSNGYERGAPAQRINGEVGYDFDPHVVDMQDGILRIYLE